MCSSFKFYFSIICYCINMLSVQIQLVFSYFFCSFLYYLVIDNFYFKFVKLMTLKLIHIELSLFLNVELFYARFESSRMSSSFCSIHLLEILAIIFNDKVNPCLSSLMVMFFESTNFSFFLLFLVYCSTH